MRVSMKLRKPNLAIQRLKSYAFPLALSLIMGSVYLVTASRGMFWLDAPRFIAAILTSGVGNPPEPLYMILAYPFARLPVGSVVLGIQVLSGFLAAVTLFFLYILTTRILASIRASQKEGESFPAEGVLPAGLFALFSLGFSYQFWTQAQNVEDFILVTLLDVFVLILLIAPIAGRGDFFRRFLWIGVILGLASGTNPIAASVVFSVIFVFWPKRKMLTSKGFLKITLAGLITVFGVYFYVWQAASFEPFLNWRRPVDLASLWELATGAGLNFNMPERGLLNGFTGSFDVFMLSSGNYLKMIWLNFTPALLPFIILGGFFLFAQNCRLFWILALTLISNFVFSGIYLSGNQESWYLVSDAILAVLSGLGFYWAVNFIPKRWRSLRGESVGELLAGTFYVLIFVTLVFRWSSLDRRKWMITEDYVQNLYLGAKGPALLFGTHDLFDSNTYYAHALYGEKTQVIPLGVDYIYDMEWYKKNIAANTDIKFPTMKLTKDNPFEYSAYMEELFTLNMPKYRIYLTIPAIRNNFFPIANFGPSLRIDPKKFKLVPSGMVQELVATGSARVPEPWQYNYRFTSLNFPHSLPVIYDRTFKIELTHMIHEYAQSYQFLADYALGGGRPELALEYYKRAYEFDPLNIEVLGRLGNFYGTYGSPSEGIDFINKAIQLDPGNITFHYNLALLKKRAGDEQGAVGELLKILELGRDQSRLTEEDKRLVGQAQEIVRNETQDKKPAEK